MNSLNILANPVSSLLYYLDAIENPEIKIKQEQLKKWMLSQSPDHPDLVDRIISNFGINKFVLEIDFIATLFKELGWLPHYVFQVIYNVINLLETNNIITICNGHYKFSIIGKKLHSERYDIIEYVKSINSKATYWMSHVVKIYNNDNIGTGFFVSNKTIVTCKHVIDGLRDEINIGNEESMKFDIVDIKNHSNPDVDLALIIVKPNYDFININILTEKKLLRKVFTLGYPRIPLTTKPFVVCNQGEISSIVDNYLNNLDFFILSFIVRPGNSGGALIDEFGNLVGIITQHVFSNDDNGESRNIFSNPGYSAAIPSKYLVELMNL